MDRVSVEDPGGIVRRSARSAALRCAACGARERVRAPARRHGWQRCGHCSEVIVAPWSEAEAFEGPSARTVVLQLRGRAHFMVPRRTLLTTPELALWVFLLFAFTAFSVGAIEIDADPLGLWRRLGPPLCVFAGVSIAALLARRWATVQHLEISPTRLLAYRSVGGRRCGAIERRVDPDIAITAEQGGQTPTGTTGRHFRVKLRSGACDDQPIEIRVSSGAEARWIAVLVRAAVSGTDLSLRCPGCGAPVAVGIEERASGSSVCAHCDAGFVVGVRGICWGPLELMCPEAENGLRAPRYTERSPYMETSPCVETARRVESTPQRNQAAELRGWQVPHASVLSQTVASLGLVWNTLSASVFGGITLWLSQQTPVGSVGLTAFALCASLLLFATAAAALFFAAFAVFGRERFGVDEATLRSGGRLAGFELPSSWWVPVIDGPLLVPAGWRRVGSALPIARLTRVAFERKRDDTRLRFETPTRSLELAWSMPDAEDRWLRRELALALAERLRGVGREVVMTRGERANRADSLCGDET